jgi:hypothetical protein
LDENTTSGIDSLTVIGSSTESTNKDLPVEMKTFGTQSISDFKVDWWMLAMTLCDKIPAFILDAWLLASVLKKLGKFCLSILLSR